MRISLSVDVDVEMDEDDSWVVDAAVGGVATRAIGSLLGD